MTHADLIRLWPSLSEFAADLDVNYVTAKAMRFRSSIPASYWVAMVDAARRRGISGVDYQALAEAAACHGSQRLESREAAE
jgi:hypothetical protein